jgi:putative ABC transport system permease protein
MDILWQDLRFSVRTLAHNPGGTSLALLMLALGIGANTAIFSVVSAVLLQPLPYPHPEQLVAVIDSAPKLGFPRFAASPPNFNDWRQQNQVFSAMSAMTPARHSLTGGGARPEAVIGASVTGDFFRTLGARPQLGRFLLPADDRPGGERVVVLASGLWHRRFGGDPGILNRQITIDGRSYTVVGVAPGSLTVPRKAELWVPLALDYAKEGRGAHYLAVLARLKPGVSLERAQADMSAVAARLERQYPDNDTGWGVNLVRWRDLVVEDIRPALATLQRAVWVVLLIACANVANLLLARMAARERELAVRAAMGASRARLVRLIVGESVLLFAAGGALGLLLAYWGTRALVRLNPDAIPRSEGIGIDGRVLAYTLLVSLATGVVFGLVPALSAVGRRLHGALKEGGRAMSGGTRGRLVRNGLVLAEVALALVLLIGAGLLIQSFARLQSVDPGFTPGGVLTASLSLPEAKYPDNPRQASFYRQALERIRALPGVAGAASVFPLPLGGGDWVLHFDIQGRPASKPGEAHDAKVRYVSPDYFATLRIPCVKGRLFTAQDDENSQQVVVVNRAMVAKFWPAQDLIGQRMTFGDPAAKDAKWLTIVGVVGDVRDAKLDRKPEAEAFRPQFQDPASDATLVVRTTRNPQSLVAPIRQAVQQLDRDLPLDKVQTYDQIVADSLAQNRVKTVLLAIFAGLALLLAATGIYGVVSYSVSQRLHEIGIRIALGAARAEVLLLVLRQGMTLVVLGLAVGIAGSWLTARLLASQLYDISVNDPLTYAGVPLLLAAVALAANWLPARRATRVDPLEALRAE